VKSILITILIIIAIIALIGGFTPAIEAIKLAGTAFLSMFAAILPFLGLEQTILTKVVAIVIIQIICGLGFYLSYKAKNAIFQAISVIADVISTILLIVG